MSQLTVKCDYRAIVLGQAIEERTVRSYCGHESDYQCDCISTKYRVNMNNNGNLVEEKNATESGKGSSTVKTMTGI